MGIHDLGEREIHEKHRTQGAALPSAWATTGRGFSAERKSPGGAGDAVGHVPCSLLTTGGASMHSLP